MSDFGKILTVFGAITLIAIAVENPKKTVEILEAVNEGFANNNTSSKAILPKSQETIAQKNYGVIRTGYFKCTDAVKRFFRWIW